MLSHKGLVQVLWSAHQFQTPGLKIYIPNNFISRMSESQQMMVYCGIYVHIRGLAFLHLEELIIA